MQFSKYILFLILQIFAFSITAQTNWESKVDPVIMDKVADGSSISFLILMKEQANVDGAKLLITKDAKAAYVYNEIHKTAKKSQAGLKNYLKAKEVPFQSLQIVNVIKAKGNLDLIKSIAQRAEVKNIQDNPYAEFDGPVRLTEENGGARAVEWGIENINADDVWAMGYQGSGVVVGGQDTGYDWEHPALKKKYRGTKSDGTADHDYNWHDAIHDYNPLNDSLFNPCGLDVQFPCDDNRHGTHTMGTMVGSEGDNEIGVAPESKWCACRNMDRGWGSPFTYLECFEWFVAPTDLNNENPDPTKAPHVIANSWGCPEIEGCNPMNFELLNTAVKNLKAAGTVVVVSAGNDGRECNTIMNPASIFEASFTVGAYRQNDTIANFSSRGPVIDSNGILKPNITAPGVGVRSSVLNGEYNTFNGTSMAGPHVAGVVALMISANPELAGQVDIIEDIIESTARPMTSDEDCGNILGSEVPNHTYGWGRIDALAAVEKSLTIFPVSNENVLAGQVVVYPNPFDQVIQLEFTNIEGQANFELFDLNGRLVKAQSMLLSGKQTHRILSNDLGAGMYFYKINGKDQTFEGKIIKQ